VSPNSINKPIHCINAIRYHWELSALTDSFFGARASRLSSYTADASDSSSWWISEITRNFINAMTLPRICRHASQLKSMTSVWRQPKLLLCCRFSWPQYGSCPSVCPSVRPFILLSIRTARARKKQHSSNVADALVLVSDVSMFISKGGRRH